MFKKGIIKITSLLLLFAVVGMVVPLQQVFHHHEDQVCHAGEGKSALSVYEKSCCKKTDFFHHAQAILQEQGFTFLDTNYHYKASVYTGTIIFAVYFTANKAPPVA